MTIDETITWLNTDDYESKGFADATSVAINIMRKYQKIEALINSWELGLIDNIGHEISEVLEDGKMG